MGRRDHAQIATNVTAPSRPLVGREDELSRIRERFDQGRLLTVLGAGGMGKTRVALAYGMSVVNAYGAAGGVWFVDLTNVQGRESFLASVAFALGSGVDASRRNREHEVADRLRQGATVLILDNFEQLVGECAAVVERWVQQAPGLRVLVTSRARLGAPSEQVLSLGPLSLEAGTQLFFRRMRDLDTFDPEADRAIAERIVDAVDRMPLAIELAASRTSVLTLAELEHRLKRPLEVLRTATGGEARHGSVERAVRDSVALLTEPERRFFALLSVFRDGARTSDIEAVLGSLPVGELAPLDALERLHRVSLLRSDRSGPVARHAFFRTIREVAEALAAEEPLLAEARARHTDRYVERAEAWARERVELHEGDVENLVAAHAAAVAGGSADHACVLVSALEASLWGRGRIRDALAAYDATVEVLRSDDTVTGERVASVWLGRARALQDTGQTAAARAAVQVALESSEGHPVQQAEAWLQLGALDDVAGDTTAARERYERALTLLDDASEAVDPRQRQRLRVEAQRLTGHAHRREGHLDAALRLTTASVIGARELGDRRAEASALYEKGVVQLFLGDESETLATFDEGLRVAEAAGLPVMEGAMKTARACLLQELGQLDEALRGHSDAARRFEWSGSRHREGSALYYLGTTYLDRGEPGAALPVLERARERLAPVGAARYDALVSSAMALAWGGLGDLERAEAESSRAGRAVQKVPDEPALAVAVSLRAKVLEVWAGGVPDLGTARALVARHGTDDTRASLRALERAAARHVELAPAALEVWSDGSAFLTPDGSEPARLPPGSPLRGLLVGLARARIESPAEWVPVEALIEAGWPGEKIGAEAALNRLYVALTTLRKKGLRPFLEKGPGGYALTPGVVARWRQPD